MNKLPLPNTSVVIIIQATFNFIKQRKNINFKLCRLNFRQISNILSVAKFCVNYFVVQLFSFATPLGPALFGPWQQL